MSEKRQPWLKFYPADWRDPRLRMCSLAARGLWIDLISYMHEGEPYGHLTIGGVSPSHAEIAAMIGRPVGEVRKAIVELAARGVYSKTDNGVIYSRRMVRDKAKAEQDRANGKGGGNPKLRGEVKSWVNPPDKAQRLDARGQKPEEEIRPPPSEGEAAAAERDGDLLDIPPSLDRTTDGECVRAWNAMAERTGLPACMNLTKARRSSLKLRLAECGGVDGFKIALGKLEASKFCRGENERGWRADFDFLMQPKSFTRLMEGKYDDAPSRPNGHPSPDDQRRQDRADILEGMGLGPPAGQ